MFYIKFVQNGVPLYVYGPVRSLEDAIDSAANMLKTKRTHPDDDNICSITQVTKKWYILGIWIINDIGIIQPDTSFNMELDGALLIPCVIRYGDNLPNEIYSSPCNTPHI